MIRKPRHTPRSIVCGVVVWIAQEAAPIALCALMIVAAILALAHCAKPVHL